MLTIKLRRVRRHQPLQPFPQRPPEPRQRVSQRHRLFQHSGRQAHSNTLPRLHLQLSRRNLPQSHRVLLHSAGSCYVGGFASSLPPACCCTRAALLLDKRMSATWSPQPSTQLPLRALLRCWPRHSNTLVTAWRLQTTGLSCIFRTRCFPCARQSFTSSQVERRAVTPSCPH